MIVRIGMLGKWLAMGVLAAANVLASGQTAGPGKYRIAGRMVNAATGEPVRRASVALLAESDSHTVASVESDGEGQFVFTGLGAGKFQLTASKRGFRTAFYDEHEEYSSAIVTGEGEETGGLVFRLVPGSVLYGVVAGDGGNVDIAHAQAIHVAQETLGRLLIEGPGGRRDFVVLAPQPVLDVGTQGLLRHDDPADFLGEAQDDPADLKHGLALSGGLFVAVRDFLRGLSVALCLGGGAPGHRHFGAAVAPLAVTVEEAGRPVL